MKNREPTRVRPWPAAVLLAALLIGNTACITVYQPLSGLHAPVLVDPALGNFDGLRILVHCIPKDILEDQAARLCQRVGQLLENQGAEVETVATIGRIQDDASIEEGEGDEKPRTEVDLVVELRARHVHENTDTLMWTLSFLTLTLAPGISENSFVQEVMIRDGKGSPLVNGELRGRIVRYFGLGYWASNKLLDLIARDDDEELTAEQMRKSLSEDLYEQLSQMVFNANMRRRVLGAAEAAGDS